MQDLSTLESKSLAELREIGKAFGITDTTLKKKELLNAIIGKTMSNGEEENTLEPAADEAPRKRGRRPRVSSTRVEDNKPSTDNTATEPAI